MANGKPDIGRQGFRTNPADEERYKFDKIVHAITTISEPHRLAHDGMMFHFTHLHSAVVNGGTEDLLFKVPAGAYPHLNTMRVNAGGGDLNIYLYEGTTVSADGTAVTVHNTNRNSSNTADTPVYHTPTVTGVGTEIHHQWLPPSATGAGQTHDGVTDAQQGEEWILAPSTNYMLRVENNSGNTIDIWVEVLFYEVGYPS